MRDLSGVFPTYPDAITNRGLIVGPDVRSGSRCEWYALALQGKRLDRLPGCFFAFSSISAVNDRGQIVASVDVTKTRRRADAHRGVLWTRKP